MKMKDGHQPNSRGLYTHYKDSLLKVGWVYPRYKELRKTLAHVMVDAAGREHPTCIEATQGGVLGGSGGGFEVS